MLYAGIGWVIGCFLDYVRSKGVRVLGWCVGISAAALALAGGIQESRFRAVQQREDGRRPRYTRRWEWPWSIASALVAAESEKAVLQALRNLDEQDGIIRRYGRLEALRGEGYRRHDRGFYPGWSYLVLPRVLAFEKAEARVKIVVQHGPILRVQIKMYPTQEYVEEHPEISLEIVGSEIEYVGGPPDAVDEPVGPQIKPVGPDVRRKSMIDIEVDHPEFRGE